MATSTKWIEELAVHALKTVLLRCPLLESYIDYNDRTPSWDGSILIYNHQDRKKEQLVGRVPVQVKGTQTQIVSEVATFSCDIKDLRNYYNDGGCIYFRICVKPGTDESTVFYSALHVYDLKDILDKAGKQKSYTIKLVRFPVDNPEEITAICLDFLENARKQKSFIGKELQSLEDLERNGVKIEALTFTTSGVEYNPVKIGNYLSSHDFYLYAKPQGIDVEIPIEKVSNATLFRTVPGKVQVKDTEYYSSYCVVHENGKQKLRIGKGLTLSLDLELKCSNISYHPMGTLSDVIRDTECFLDMMENQEITINGGRVQFHLNDPYDPDRFNAILRTYSDIKKMLDYLGVTEELQCDDLTDKDRINLKNFVDAVLYNKNIGFPGSDEQTALGAFKIANLSIWIWADKQKDGYYKVENFFSEHKIVFFKNDDIKHIDPIPATQFLLLNSDAYAFASNMDVDTIHKDIRAMKPHPALVEKVTFMLLDVLNGYDKQEKKDDRLLDLADTIWEWLSNEANNSEQQVLKLNRLQIVKRRRPLVFAEKTELSELARDKSPHIRCAAFLLLDENREAQKCFEELSPENQEQFLSYPISHFGQLEKRKG